MFYPSVPVYPQMNPYNVGFQNGLYSAQPGLLSMPLPVYPQMPFAWPVPVTAESSSLQPRPLSPSSPPIVITSPPPSDSLQVTVPIAKETLPMKPLAPIAETGGRLEWSHSLEKPKEEGKGWKDFLSKHSLVLALGVGAATVAGLAMLAGKPQSIDYTAHPKPVTYHLNDFKVPPGLETAVQRREMAFKIINKIYPAVWELIEKKDQDPLWQTKINKLYNEALNELAVPQGYPRYQVLTYFNQYPQDMIASGTYSAAFLNERVGQGYFRNNPPLNPVDKKPDLTVPSHEGFNLLYSAEERSQPCFYLGELAFSMEKPPQTPEEKLSFYNTLVHETNHLLRVLRDRSDFENRDSIRKAFSTDKDIYNGLIFSGFGLFTDPTIQAEYGQDKFSSKKQFLLDIIEKKKSVLAYESSDYCDKLFGKLDQEGLRHFYNNRIVNEYEAYVTSFELLNPKHKLDFAQKKLTENHLSQLHTALYLREIMAYMEEKVLKLPTAERYEQGNPPSIAEQFPFILSELRGEN